MVFHQNFGHRLPKNWSSFHQNWFHQKIGLSFHQKIGHHFTKILVIDKDATMLLPFDHVTIQDYEFVLHYKHKGPSMFDGNAAGWHAIDTYGNDVCIRQQDVKKLEPFIFKGMTRFEEPTFFKVDDGRWQRVDSEQMHHDINLGHLSGGFTTKDGHSNTWNIQTMTIEDNEDIYTLKILTRGGWWL